MKKQLKLALAAATSVLLLAGCSDFLKGPGLSNNPNVPTTASADQLWTGASVAVMAQWENYPFMLFFLWAQQISGVNRQWQNYADFAGGTDLNTSEGSWDQTYSNGGLFDLRKVDSILLNAPPLNTAFLGESRVLEALYIGTAADMYGSVPYSTAVQQALPTFDTQAQVFAEVQTTLDSAIADLTAGGSGPTNDLWFHNDYSKWIAVAHTLKARFYMHTAKATGAYNAAILDSVIKYTTIGITSDVGNLTTIHGTNPGDQNLFFNFLDSRAGDVEPSKMHINLIKASGETALLDKYYVSSLPGDSMYGSAADSSGGGGGTVATFATKATTPTPIVTYVENQMLLAEAQYLRGQTANALTTLSTYRTTQGVATPALAGAALQGAIIREKYIHIFFNVEVWDDYLRTCYPNVPMTYNMQSAGASASPYVPGRLPVGATEQQVNPNLPPQPSGNPGNGNFPKNLTNLAGDSACFGQVNRPGT